MKWTVSRRLALLWLLLLVLVSLSAEWWGPALLEPDLSRVLEPPNASALMGRDSLGRDLLARLALGTKVSLTVGLAGSFLAILIGGVLGVLAGYHGRWVDRLVMRSTDVFLSVPSFALVAVLVTGLQAPWLGSPGLARDLVALALAIGLTHWMNVARVTRGLVMQVKVQPYMEAARSIGASEARLILRHIGPNVLPQLAVLLALQIPANILYESFMSFIGLGVQAPATSWGLLVQEGWRSLSVYPHTMLFPCLVLFVTIWSMNVVGRSGRGRFNRA